MNNDIQIAGCCVGDRVLALYRDCHIFNRITKIEVGEDSVHFYVSGEPLTQADIIANVTRSGVDHARQVLKERIVQRESAFLAFCKSCIETWNTLSFQGKADMRLEFQVHLDLVTHYRALLDKLDDYEKYEENYESRLQNP